MAFIGIDVAKYRHCAAVIDAGEWKLEDFEFTNDEEGFAALLAALEDIGASPGEASVCLEATGHYGINPNKIFPVHNGAGGRIRGPRGQSAAHEQLEEDPEPSEGEERRDRREGSSDVALQRQSGAAQGPGREKRRSPPAREVPHLPDKDYRGCEAARHGGDRPGVSRVPSLLLRHVRKGLDGRSLPLSLGGRPLTGPGRCRGTRARRRCGSQVHAGGRDRSQGARTHLGGTCQLLDQIRFTLSQIEAVDARIKSMIAGSLITTIPGIGHVCGAAILAEIGDISRFESPGKLVAFAGCDPTVFASGQFQSTSAHLSRAKGSPPTACACTIP